MVNDINADPRLTKLLQETESLVEFKAARNNFSNEEFCKIASGLSNANGGKIVFGITDKRPRQVCGSSAFTPERALNLIQTHCKISVEVELIRDVNGAVLIITIGKHRRGIPTQDGKGRAWMREGERTVPLSETRRCEIYAKVAEDFSAKICEQAGLNDLSQSAIETFRSHWLAKLNASSRDQDRQTAQRVEHQPISSLLHDIEAAYDGKITWAALILFGTSAALGRYLSQAEIVFEYRSGNAPGPAQERENLRAGFFDMENNLWQLINKRNDQQNYQSGLYVHQISTFEQRPVREVILNAVTHRDYQHPGNVFLRQYPRRLVCESPGGFLPGITVDNILNKQLLLYHLKKAGTNGAPLRELQQVIPSLSKSQIKYRLQSLRQKNRIETRGNGRSTRWYIADVQSDKNEFQ